MSTSLLSGFGVSTVRVLCAISVCMVGMIAQAVLPSSETKQNIPAVPKVLSSSSSPLAVVADPGVKTDGGYPAQANYSFGQVSLLDAPVVEKVFKIRNVSQKTVTVGRIQGSCGCLSAVIAPQTDAKAKPNTGTGLATLKPGETVSVRATVNLEVLYPGNLSKTMYVYIDDPSGNPALRIDMTGTLMPTVTFDPPTLSFGAVQAGASKTLTLTVQPDARLVTTGGAPPPLLPTAPGIKATLLPNGKQGKWQYAVSLDQGIPLGALNGYLSFAPDTKTSGDLNAMRAWRSARVSVVAGIVGDVSASPPSVAFGLVSLKSANDKPSVPGQEDAPLATVATRLVPIKSDALTGATIQCDNPFVSAEIVKVKSASGGETDSLSIRLRRGIESGALQTRVVLRLANGQELIVPVSAYVQP